MARRIEMPRLETSPNYPFWIARIAIAISLVQRIAAGTITIGSAGVLLIGLIALVWDLFKRDARNAIHWLGDIFLVIALFLIVMEWTARR